MHKPILPVLILFVWVYIHVIIIKALQKILISVLLIDEIRQSITVALIFKIEMMSLHGLVAHLPL